MNIRGRGRCRGLNYVFEKYLRGGVGRGEEEGRRDVRTAGSETKLQRQSKTSRVE